jgi:hypothetical protein
MKKEYELADELLKELGKLTLDELIRDPKGAENHAILVAKEGRKHLERTGELIMEVSRKTGFLTHQLQRLIEISVLSSRPKDRFTIQESTGRKLIISFTSCSIRQRIPEKCTEFCSCFLSTLCRELKVDADQSIALSQRECRWVVEIKSKSILKS